MTESKRKGLGGFDKLLIGCGIGCAALVLLAVLGVGFGSMWLFTPGEQVATDVIATDSSLGVVRLHELADDPGAQELLSRVLQRVDEAGRRQQREQLPESLRWISDLQTQQSNPAGVNMLIPKEMTIAYEASEDGSSIDFAVAANPRTMVRVFKTMLGLISRGESNKVRSDYRGHAGYVLEQEAHLAFVGSTVVFATSRYALERAIDRVAARQAAIDRGEIEVPGDAVSTGGAISASIPGGDWDVEGAFRNDFGLIESYLAEPSADLGAGDDEAEWAVASQPTSGAGPGDLDDLIADEDLRFGFGFDVVSADEVSGRLVIECGDRQTAQRWLPALERRYRELRDETAQRGHELEIEARADGDRVLTELSFRGLEDLLAEALTAPQKSGATEEESP